MKASKMTVSALSALALMMAAGSVFAATPMTATGSTINFNGEVTNGACGIAVNSKDQNVTLATAPVAAVVKGAVYKPTQFSITLEGCATDTYSTASFDFTGQTASGDATALANTAPQNAAGGVGVQLMDTDSKVITINSAGQGAKMTLASGSSNTARFSAGIYGLSSGTVTSGNVNATTNFNIRYE